MSAGAIARVRLGSYRYAFREPWPSAEGPQRFREGIHLALEDDEGRVGVGESAPFPGFGMETLGSSESALRLAARYAVGLPTEHLLAAADDLPRLAPVVASPGARAALDLALHDLEAQRRGIPLAGLLAVISAARRPISAGARAAGPTIEAADHVVANAILGRGLSPDGAAAAAGTAIAEGATTLKLKVGGGPIADDVARVRAVRDAVGPDTLLRLDANRAWNEEDALAFLRGVEPLAVEYVEEPLASGAVESLARLRAACAVPIAADEFLVDLPAARRLVAARAVDVFVVKPMAIGGLAAAQQAIAIAHGAGLRVTVTSLVESAVGRSGALHLAASLGAGAGAHGVATGDALLEDVVAGFASRPGPIPLPGGSGLGDEIRRAALARTTPLAVEEPA